MTAFPAIRMSNSEFGKRIVRLIGLILGPRALGMRSEDDLRAIGSAARELLAEALRDAHDIPFGSAAASLMQATQPRCDSPEGCVYRTIFTHGVVTWSNCLLCGNASDARNAAVSRVEAQLLAIVEERCNRMRRANYRRHQARAIHVKRRANEQFVECDSCRAKPGSPTLCAGCLNNRRVIEALTGRMSQRSAKPPRAAAVAAHQIIHEGRMCFDTIELVCKGVWQGFTLHLTSKGTRLYSQEVGMLAAGSSFSFGPIDASVGVKVVTP